MIKFLPSYVGSKSFWVKHLQFLSGKKIAEPFAGSAVISANLASSCVLNDLDKYVYKILSEFDKQIVFEPFSKEDYFFCRKLKDWYNYAYMLCKLSFSGVFRYSKNGFNVPIKHEKDIFVREDYLTALDRWKKLSPSVSNKNYWEINELIVDCDVLILDPPYEKAQASYNKDSFDFEFYWNYVYYNENICKTVILFDFLDNMMTEKCDVRKTKVNGARAGNLEAIFIFEDSLKSGQYGENIFSQKHSNTIEKLDGLKNDFRILKSGETIELKSDYYDSDRTENFFFERYSYDDIDGGPWQALKNKNDYFVYFFIKNDVEYIFDTQQLVDKLDEIVSNYKLIDVPNKNHITRGYKIPREVFKEIYLLRKSQKD